MHTSTNDGEAVKHHGDKPHTVNVRVRYAPAKHPFTEPHAHAAETLAKLKARTLEHFHLTEGPVDGGSKTYVLSHNNHALTNLEETIGQLAHEGELHLMLLEQFTQG